MRTDDMREGALDARSCAERSRQVIAARHNNELEGLTISPATLADADEYFADNRDEITALVTASDGAALLDEPGIGAINAAVIIAAWSHAGRVRSEAAFAVLAGVSPVPASNGNTTRHLLNRGGDRRLNRALSFVLTRMSHHPPTRAYVERRRAEGRTGKEIRQSLKRYLAPQLYRRLAHENALDRT